MKMCEDMRLRKVWTCDWICRIDVLLSVLLRIHVFRNVTLCDWMVADVLKHCDPWNSIILWNIWMHRRSYFLYILGLMLLPVVVALSSAWSVPFLACMSRWIMSGRTMLFSSRIVMVLRTTDRKKFTTELGMILMWRNYVHETENKYYKWHNIINANSCLCHTYKTGISEMAWLCLRKYALARNLFSSVFCCLGLDTSPWVHHRALLNRKVFLHLCFWFLLKAS